MKRAEPLEGVSFRWMPMRNTRHSTMSCALLLAFLQAGILAGAQLAYPVRTGAQTADELVAKVLQARGGLEKAKAVQSERITGKIYFNAEMYGPFLAEFKRPGKMHNEVTIKSKTVVRTFNGKDAGWVINPFVGKKAKGNVIELAGTEKVEGRDAYILKVTHKDGTISSYSFDAQTFLLTKWSGVDNMNGESVMRETFFRDYRDVNGLKFAFEVASDTPGTEDAQRIVVDKIEVDPQIDDSHFEKPSAPAASPAAAPAATPPGGR
jgi:hypothetical protein